MTTAWWIGFVLMSLASLAGASPALRLVGWALLLITGVVLLVRALFRRRDRADTDEQLRRRYGVKAEPNS